MKIVKLKTIREYWEHYPQVRGQLEAWVEHVKRSNWHTPAELQADGRNVRVLPDNRAVFNIKGNDYRLVVRLNYHTMQVFVRFFGTHAEYDQINALEI